MRYNVPRKISVRLSQTLLDDLKKIIADGPRWLTLSDHVQAALVDYRQKHQAPPAAVKTRKIKCGRCGKDILKALK